MSNLDLYLLVNLKHSHISQIIVYNFFNYFNNNESARLGNLIKLLKILIYMESLKEFLHFNNSYWNRIK